MRKHLSIIFFLAISFSLIGQELCNPNSKEIFSVTEIMPESSPDLASIEQLINSKFKVSDCNLNNGDKIIVSFKINCEGEDFDYKVLKLNKAEVKCGLEDFFQTILSWSKAKQNKYYVDFSGSLIFAIENSRFILLSESINNLKSSK